LGARQDRDSDSRSRLEAKSKKMDQIMLRDGNCFENFETAIRGEMTRAAHGGTVQAGLGSAMGNGAFRAARKLLSGLVTGTIIIALAAIVAAMHPAQALPSFAQQTGQPCGTCHTDIPGLTPYGRLFKIKGYTVGGGPTARRRSPLPTIPARARIGGGSLQSR
jgi:hypothetical protein